MIKTASSLLEDEIFCLVRTGGLSIRFERSLLMSFEKIEQKMKEFLINIDKDRNNNSNIKN